ncbi:MAG: serine/threonine protein kinase, partial [Cyanobacteria bacterium]|nr:serine/threonine protein kinase [Cyanobacteriota bacterium]
LNDEEKASVFYSIRKWAPLVTMDAKVQEKLLGSTIMQEARYTQIWFDLLINQKQNMKEQSLNEGDCLQEGKYKILSRIGRGGQAQVYLASRQVEGEPEQNLVLKEFILSDSDSLAALLESASDFERESSILGRLSHANIVKMEEIFAENRRAYLVLEYVEGISLREHVRKYGNLSEEKTLDLALAMTDILQYLHQQDNPITHCDFSPDNILLRSDGSIKLIDFSIASTAATVNTNCLGKHAYIPPEQFRSTPCPQSDIYALGATLYFLLTGQDPKPITCSDPRSVNAGISEAIASIVKKSTTLDLKDRYSDIEWLRMDLLSAQSTAPPSESEGIAISIATKELENA